MYLLTYGLKNDLSGALLSLTRLGPKYTHQIIVMLEATNKIHFAQENW
jgi:hypothetical protein